MTSCPSAMVRAATRIRGATRSVGCWLLLPLCLATTSAGEATDLTPRDKLEHHGWVIGFAGSDREIAAALVPRLEKFESRIEQIKATSFPLGPAEIEARVVELAAAFARLCALPERQADFEAEIRRFIPSVAEVHSAVPRMLLPTALDLWRTEEVLERAKSRSLPAGLVWNADTGRPQRAVLFHWVLNTTSHQVSWNETPPPAIMLVASVPRDNARAAAAQFADELDAWINEVATGYPRIMAQAASLAIWSGAFNVLHDEVSDDPTSRWVISGIAGWAWLNVAESVLPSAQANRHAEFAQQLPVSGVGRPRLSLEQWPAEKTADHDAMARQVFCNITDWHGAEAVDRVLRAFWQLPKKSRTSAGLKAVYRELMHEPLQARAPWRSLDEPDQRTDL